MRGFFNWRADALQLIDATGDSLPDRYTVEIFCQCQSTKPLCDKSPRAITMLPQYLARTLPDLALTDH